MRLLLAILASSLVFAYACSDSTPAASVHPDADADAMPAPETSPDAAGDAAPLEEHDASTDGGTALQPTKTTAADATINGVSRPLTRAQFATSTKDNTPTLYFEAHQGGAAACPETETPARTLIVDGVPVGAPGASFTDADGVVVSFIDFTGDQITADNPTTHATAVKVTIVEVVASTSAEIEVEATFAEGTVKGRIYGAYCAAMSD
jgi:hypothetical protein